MLDHCEDCLKGVLHSGTPKGSMTTIDGVDTYVSLPAAGKYDQTLAVLFLGDIYGIYANAQLICDGFAENGYATYFPDYLNKDPVPLEEMNAGRFDLGAWSKNHTEAHTRPTLDKVIAALKKQGVTNFTCAGYCYGGKYAVALAVDNVVTCAVAAHPSGIRVPEDLDLLREKSKAPFLINACETDRTVSSHPYDVSREVSFADSRCSRTQWPRHQQDKAEEMMGGGRYAPGWKQNYYPGCTHGYAVRGDITDNRIKYGKEESFKQTVAWFNKYAK